VPPSRPSRRYIDEAQKLAGKSFIVVVALGIDPRVLAQKQSLSSRVLEHQI
jgi:hypothetical protein